MTALSPTLCGDTLYRGGARQLVEMASGLNGAMGYLERCGAAELLHFCLSRVRLTPERATDRELLRELPALVHILRVCTVPLFLPIQKGIKLAHPIFAASLPEKELLRCYQNAENALVLLRGLIGTIWGMAAALRNFGQPLHITGTLYSFLLRCLSFSVDKSCGFKLAAEFCARRAEHALVLRNTALGVLACCEMKAEYALKPADLSEIEQEAAVKKLQGMRRAQMLRRKAIAEEKARLEREAEIERRRKAGMSAFMDEDESPSPTNGQRSRRASTDMRFTRKHKETDRAMAASCRPGARSHCSALFSSWIVRASKRESDPGQRQAFWRDPALRHALDSAVAPGQACGARVTSFLSIAPRLNRSIAALRAPCIRSGEFDRCACSTARL